MVSLPRNEVVSLGGISSYGAYTVLADRLRASAIFAQSISDEILKPYFPASTVQMEYCPRVGQAGIRLISNQTILIMPAANVRQRSVYASVAGPRRTC